MAIKQYIELMLLDDHVVKFNDGYQLDISSLSSHEKQNFLDYALAHDAAFKEMLEDKLQELIDQELPIIECEMKYSKGLRPVHDAINGEVTWIRREVI